jgi:hypothetical protein
LLSAVTTSLVFGAIKALYIDERYIRVTWVNEMKDEKISESLFKSFCEGRLKTTKLYEDGKKNFCNQSYTVANANNMPNIKIDTGVQRKFVGFTHQSYLTNKRVMLTRINTFT